jgi:thiol-disulfide isomerase/thioredoxin
MTDLDRSSAPLDPDKPAPRRLPRWIMWVAGFIMVGALVGIGALMFASDDATPPTTFADLSSLAGDAPAAEEQAPDFTVPTLEGDTFVLSTHLAEDGRPVFLNLWASWCFPCRAEMPDIDAAAQAHPDVEFIGVAVQDSTADATAFAREIGVQYTIGFDEDDMVEDGYPALGMPSTYLISSEGVILDVIIGAITAEDIDTFLAENLG